MESRVPSTCIKRSWQPCNREYRGSGSPRNSHPIAARNVPLSSGRLRVSFRLGKRLLLIQERPSDSPGQAVVCELPAAIQAHHVGLPLRNAPSAHRSYRPAQTLMAAPEHAVHDGVHSQSHEPVHMQTSDGQNPNAGGGDRGWFHPVLLFGRAAETPVLERLGIKP
jgi:hypothetical protein